MSHFHAVNDLTHGREHIFRFGRGWVLAFHRRHVRAYAAGRMVLCLNGYTLADGVMLAFGAVFVCGAWWLALK